MISKFRILEKRGTNSFSVANGKRVYNFTCEGELYRGPLKIKKKISKLGREYFPITVKGKTYLFTEIELSSFLEDPEKTINSDPVEIWGKFQNEITDLYMEGYFTAIELGELYELHPSYILGRIKPRKRGIKVFPNLFIGENAGYGVFYNKQGKKLNPHLEKDSAGREGWWLDTQWGRNGEYKKCVSAALLVARYFIPNPRNITQTTSLTGYPTLKIKDLAWGAKPKRKK